MIGGVDHLGLLERVSGAFERELAGVAGAARCAAVEWSVAELGAHLGGVHGWAAGIVRSGERGERANVPEVAGGVVKFYGRMRRELLTALEELDPERECWTFDRTWRRVGFWRRRQAYEALVHLWDLRSATDPGAPAPAEAAPELCADAVDELLTLFMRRGGKEEPLPGAVALRATDTGQRWVLTEEWTVSEHADRAAATEVAGLAADLLLFGWGRTGLRDVTVDGPVEPLRPFYRP
jgi:uncharacterized protein (TIGR03083 family)